MKKDKKKKGCLGCLGSIIGWGLKGLGLILIVGLIASMNKTDAPQQTSPASAPTAETTQEATAAPVVTPTPTPAPTSTPEPTPTPIAMPGIGGSNAYDVVLSLVEHGIEKPETQYIDGGYQYTAGAQIGQTYVSYDIIANRDHEVCHATFNMYGPDNGFLWFAATLPYDAADKDAATAFVEAHLSGDPATLVIGDARFAIYPGEKNVMLEISDVDSEAYYSAVLDAMMSEDKK